MNKLVEVLIEVDEFMTVKRLIDHIAFLDNIRIIKYKIKLNYKKKKLS